MIMPTRAGLATLEYSAAAAEPHREGNVIIIPAAKQCPKCSKPFLGNWEFCPTCGVKAEAVVSGCCSSCGAAKVAIGAYEMFPLKRDFEQFLLLRQPPGGKWWTDGQVWFGGTDEAPFLVRMDPVAHQWAESPDDFYEAIIPPLMLTLTRKWGGDFRRQGDIFAFPLPFSWEHIKAVGDFIKANGFPFEEAKNERVFGTRHILQGRWGRIVVAGRSAVVAEGQITAPDHSPIELKGPHVLDQTARLFAPKNAD